VTLSRSATVSTAGIVKAGRKPVGTTIALVPSWTRETIPNASSTAAIEALHTAAPPLLPDTIAAKTAFDRDFLTLDKACVFQTSTDHGQEVRGVAGRPGITGIAGCCARAASGHAVATPPSRVMKSRRFN